VRVLVEACPITVAWEAAWPASLSSGRQQKGRPESRPFRCSSWDEVGDSR